MLEDLKLPRTREEIVHIQSVRKKIAFERACSAPWYRSRLQSINAERLHDPEVWRQIPILDKETLRTYDHAGFIENFCIAPHQPIAEYWRSGGTTGKPVFYPRTFEDVRYALLSWGRSFPAIGIGPGDLCHITFPIGVHPIGQMYGRSAHASGAGVTWAGAGNVLPSEAQLDLILSLGATVVLGMSSFALHLANLADTRGIDLAGSRVRLLVCSAETLSEAKRDKLSHSWGAEVYDVFGMSEAGLMGAEGDAHDGLHIWTDMYFIEVVDTTTGEPVPDGEPGTLCVTPLWTNNATPFLRWNSGDVVTLHQQGASSGPIAVVFPMIRHTRRTTGFFKIRGVNINHSEFEDFIFRKHEVNDFQALLKTGADGLENLTIRIEIGRGVDSAAVVETLAADIKRTFEVSAKVEVLEHGTLASAFQASIKAPRFVDDRD